MYEATKNVCVFQKLSNDMSKNIRVGRLDYYAPALKWLGHIVLPLSVIPSFRIQFPLII